MRTETNAYSFALLDFFVLRTDLKRATDNRNPIHFVRLLCPRMMQLKGNIFCILIIGFPIIINARIVSLESTALNEPSVIDSISIDPKPRLGRRQSTTPPRANTTVCYPLLDCFDNNEPFNNAGFEIPQSPEFISTAFILYTQEAPNAPEFLTYDGTDESLTQSSINPSRWLRIIIHGFTNNRDSIWIKPLKDALMTLTDDLESDVLVIDWGLGAKFPAYNNAASNTRLVGRQIGLLLKRLQQLKGLSLDKVHCIGHSLGAHTCGYASNAVNNGMARISGLDPAGPSFQGKRLPVRLDSTDAKFVDVIHSNTKVALGLGLGTTDDSGHIDFFVNGGESQPGCPTVSALIGGVLGGQSEAAYEQASCSHSRAHGYFIESIHSDCPYTAFPCHDYDGFMAGKCLVCPDTGCGQMGFYSMYSLGRGRMYSTTKSNAPFCGYHYFVEMVLDRDMAKTGGEIYAAIYSNYELLANVTMTPKAGADIKAGDILRHVFSHHADLGRVDYVVIYFSKVKQFLGFGGQKANEVVISRLRIRSLEDSIVYSAICDSALTVKAYTSEVVLANRFDCHD